MKNVVFKSIGLALFFCIVVVSCNTKTVCDVKMERIFDQFEAEEYEQTILMCNELQKSCPDNLGLLHARGSAYYNLDILDSAIMDYTTLLTLSPKDKLGYISRAKAYSNNEQYRLALQDLNTHVKKVGFNSEVAHQYSVNYNRLIMQDSAMYWCNKAIKMDDTVGLYYATRAILNSHVNDTLGVLRDIKNAALYSDGWEYTEVSCAVSLARVSDKFEAVQILENAAEKYPESIFLLTNLGFKYQSINDFEKAIEAHKEVLKYSQSAGYYGNVATAYSGMKNTDSILLYLNKTLEIDPHYPNAHLNRAMLCWLPLHEYKKAVADFKIGIDLDPTHPYNYNNLGYAYFKMGKLIQAKESVEYSISIYGENSYAYKNLALIHNAIGNKEQAIEATQTALDMEYPEVDPEFDSLIIDLGLDINQRKVLDFSGVHDKVKIDK